MNGKLFLAITVGAVTAALVGGFLIVGGPVQARQDRADRDRYRDLQSIAGALSCVYDKYPQGRSLPLELTVDSLTANCGSDSVYYGIHSDDLKDQETGEPYLYRRESAQAFSVCATFYDAQRTVRFGPPVWDAPLLDPKTGCVSGTLY